MEGGGIKEGRGGKERRGLVTLDFVVKGNQSVTCICLGAYYKSDYTN